MAIRFEIFRDGQRLNEYPLVSPMAIAPESVPVPTEIVFRDGVLRVGPTEQAAGAALLWDTGAGGEFILETTRLMPRGRPHNLNVELARFRLMRMLQKIEDWGLFDLPAAQPFIVRLRELQKRFGESLEQLADGAAASKIADGVLADALVLGDELALFGAEQVLARRKSQNAFARYVFGCRVDWTRRSQRVKDLMADHFDYAVLPMTWRLLQPKEDAFDTAALDEWVEFLTRRRVPIIAGPIIDLSENAMPDWAYIWENDVDVLRDLMIDFVRKMVTRYRRAVAVWNVVGGLHANSIPGLGFEQTIELTRLLVAQVKSMLPQARTLVTIRDPFGEQIARRSADAVRGYHRAGRRELRWLRLGDRLRRAARRRVYAGLVPALVRARQAQWHGQARLHHCGQRAVAKHAGSRRPQRGQARSEPRRSLAYPVDARVAGRLV
jgi:hypothetical protein